MKLNKILADLNALLGAAAKAKAELTAYEAQYQADMEALKKRHETYLKTEKHALVKAEKALVAIGTERKSKEEIGWEVVSGRW